MPVLGDAWPYLSNGVEVGVHVRDGQAVRLGGEGEAMRYRILFERGNEGRYRFISRERTTRCQSGRGHRTFESSRRS